MSPQLYIGKPKPGYFVKYEICWQNATHPVSIELACFREKMAKRIKWDLGGITPPQHFKKLAKTFWPENGSDVLVKFIWHKWADMMLEACCEHNYVGVAGCSGSGKSEFFAIWLIINFLCDPFNTLCLTTSSTLIASRMKVWGKVVKYWMPISDLGLPGKLLDSTGTLKYVDEQGRAAQGDMAGIKLIPSEKKQEKESIGTLRGVHQRRVIFAADDMPDLSDSIMESVSNISSGCEWFQFAGLANPSSYFDAFGKCFKPVKGWESITVNDERWETDRGICLHFDDTVNPKIVYGDDRLFWMKTQAEIDEIKRTDGEHTARFWRERRGFWCPTGVVEQIYTEQEILGCKADQPAIWNTNEDKVRVCFLDPAFSSGGDRTIAYFGTFGKNVEGLKTLEYNEYLEFHEDITNKELTPSQQTVKWWREQCLERKVSPKHAGFDATGAGAPFGDFVDIMWSKEVLRLKFGGKASEMPASAYDPTPSDERYVNRVTEIWYSAKEPMRTGQIKGLGSDVIKELCLRKKVDEKGIQLRIRAQPKQDMKAETGKSPDIADAAMGLSELCRERLGFSSAGAVKKQNPQKGSTAFSKLFRALDMFSPTS